MHTDLLIKSLYYFYLAYIIQIFLMKMVLLLMYIIWCCQRTCY